MLNSYPVGKLESPINSSGTLVDGILIPEYLRNSLLSTKTNVGGLRVYSSSAGNLNTGSRTYPILANTLTPINIPLNENQSFIEFTNSSIGSIWEGGVIGSSPGPLVYGKGLWVSPSYNGYASAVSTNLKNWTLQQIKLYETWNIAYGVALNGVGVFVVTSGIATQNTTYSESAFSYDGYTWNNVQMPYAKAWSSIAFGNGIFVSMGSNYVADETDFFYAVSDNGSSWRSVPKPAQGCRSVSFTNNKFITSSGTEIYTSTNGQTWTLISSYVYSPGGYPDPLAKFTYGNGRYVGASINQSYHSSTDLINWTSSSNNTAVYIRSAPSFAGGKFVMAGSNSSLATSSTDGITWTTINPLASSLYLSQTVNGKHYLTGSGGIVSSTNGTTWIDEGGIPNNNAYCGLGYKFNNNYFYSILSVSGLTEKTFIYSTDGIWWNPAYTVNQTLGDYFEIAGFFNNKFVFTPAYTTNTFSMVSTDFVSWTHNTLPASGSWKFVNGKNKMYGVSMSTTTAAESTDGITWTLRTFPTTEIPFGLTYGNGTYVATLGITTTTAYSSTDAINWTARTLPTAQTWNQVLYGNGTFVALNSTNTTAKTAAASSTDGITWASRTLPVLGNWSSGTYGNGIFYIKLDSSANVLTASSSTDGITWTLRTMGFSQGAIDAYGNGRFLGRTGSTGTFRLLNPVIPVTTDVKIYRGPQEIY